MYLSCAFVVNYRRFEDGSIGGLSIRVNGLAPLGGRLVWPEPVNDLPGPNEVWMQRQGGRKRETSRLAFALSQENFREAAQRSEMARLELERPAKIVHAAGVATEQIVQSRSLVPCLSEIRQVAQEQ